MKALLNFLTKIILTAAFVVFASFAKAQYLYDASGSTLGRIDNNYAYDASGSTLGRIDGNFLYNSSGSTIGRIDNVDPVKAVIFYFFFFNKE